MNDEAKGVKVEEVLACGFDRWYEDFKSATFASRVIPLSEEFVQYLLEDGIRLPESVDRGATSNDGDSSGWGDGGSDSDDNPPSFPEIEGSIHAAITDLGGAVLPKLNWSAPKDARWVYGTLKCQNVKEVLTLLKSSDFISHDLSNSFDDCCDRSQHRSRPDAFHLVLRRWRSIDESSEFRCFVRCGQLQAVSQRLTHLFFPHLLDPAFAELALGSINQFLSDTVHGRFPLSSYACDIVLGKLPSLKVTLVDFSPWAPSTDPLLFEWNELEATPGLAAEFRVVQREGEERSKLENYHCVPLEVAELGVSTPEEIEELCKRAERC